MYKILTHRIKNDVSSQLKNSMVSCGVNQEYLINLLFKIINDDYEENDVQEFIDKLKSFKGGSFTVWGNNAKSIVDKLSDSSKLNSKSDNKIIEKKQSNSNPELNLNNDNKNSEMSKIWREGDIICFLNDGCLLMHGIKKDSKVEDIFKNHNNFKQEIKDIRIGKNINEIAQEEFKECKNLVSVDLGLVTIIGKSAFSSCSELKSVKFPEFIKQIDNFAFNQCTNLQSIEINKVGIISPNAFERCTNLKYVKIECFSDIGRQAFARCTNLESVKISSAEAMTKSSKPEIKSDIFSSCESLKSIEVPENVIIDKSFSKKIEITRK